MKVRTEIIIGIIGVIIAILAWQFPQSEANSTKSSQSFFMPSYSQASLVISGTRASVRIKESKSKVTYNGGAITGTNSSSIIYLPKGQLLSVKVTGTKVKLEIERNISEFVNISNSGTGTEVIEI